MNSNNSGSFKELTGKINPTIKRRNFFYYLAAGAAGVYALTKMPLNIFRSKVISAARITVKESPYAVKRDMSKAGSRSVNNG